MAMWSPVAGVGAPFTNVVKLVLRQGDIPATNGAAIIDAAVYTNAHDTYVDGAYPSSNYGADPVVRFGRYGLASTNHQRAYLRFDDFQSFLPSGAVVTRALLYVTAAGASGANGAPNIYRRTSPWNEALTWDTDADYASAVMIGHTMLGAWGGAAQPTNRVSWFDITAFFRAWQDGAITNHGLQFWGNGGWGDPPTASYSFYSVENETTTNRPKLEIDYVVPGVISQPAILGGTWTARDRMELLRGPDVFDDTYIAGNYYANDVDKKDMNFSKATVVSLQAWNGGNTPKRALMKINMNHPKLAPLAKSTDPIQAGHPRLVSASLQTVGEYSWDQPYNVYRLAEDWDVNQVTYNNRYTNPVNQAWAQGWPGVGDFTMSNTVALAASSTGDDQYYRGGTKLTDITSLIQAYADGTNNLGVLIGHIGWAGTYDNTFYFTEDPYEFRRPTIVMQVWDPVLRGTLLLLK
jgi:hypothetical protein